MIKTFLAERWSWLLQFAIGQGLLLLVAYLDAAIPLRPILYVVYLTTLMFAIFLVIRCMIETRYYKQLAERDNALDMPDSPSAESLRPFERLTEAFLASASAQLRQSASRQQVALEQDKDELMSWIHEVKTPLTAMHLIIETIGDRALKASLTYEWLRIHLLLDQQLHQQRLPSMENDLYFERVDLEPLIAMEIKSLQSWCMQKGLGFDLQAEDAAVLSDAKWLAFLLRQLLANAVKYSASGASDIEVRAFERDGRTVLEVQDYGRGIDPKDLPRIYDKGFTSTAWHQDSAATGMGLYLAQKAAQAMLIKLSVRSEVGSGTTFSLVFPQPNEVHRITGM